MGSQNLSFQCKVITTLSIINISTEKEIFGTKTAIIIMYSLALTHLLLLALVVNRDKVVQSLKPVISQARYRSIWRRESFFVFFFYFNKNEIASRWPTSHGSAEVEIANGKYAKPIYANAVSLLLGKITIIQVINRQ